MDTTCTQTQGFGFNYNPFYSASNLRGHPGYDVRCGYGTPIHSPFDGWVYKVLTVNNPANDGTGYTGVFMIVDDGTECFEWHVGHCDPCVAEGDSIHKGDVIGFEANHGTVYSGNVQITHAMQKAGDQRGNHRHYQKRPLMPVRTTRISDNYITSRGGSPYFTAGFFYKIPNYNNGYNGCVSPLQPVFYRDLFIGISGYDVYVLQRILWRKSFLNTEPTGYFGPMTALALSKYQSANGIAGTSYFGPKTRTWALRETEPLPVLSVQ